MSDLATKVTEVFDYSLNTITNDSGYTLHRLISDNLITTITCSYGLCSDYLTEFSQAFNTLLMAKHKKGRNNIRAFILENSDVFRKIDSIFLHLEWSANPRICKFNIATHNTSAAKCTSDDKFYIIKCYDYFYYIYNTESNQCLMVIKNEKKALTMINILLLTPYLLYGDMFAVHGGLVSDGKNNILLRSSSLGGKTTFALLFLENGWQIITEEITYITKHGEVFNYNIRNYFNIRVGTYLEFIDFFERLGIINDTFLNMIHTDKKELFELGKKEQMSIDFDTLSESKNNITTDRITHVLKVSIEKNKSGMLIKKSSSTENVNKFLELSLAPTVMLFKDLTNIVNVKRNKRKEKLIQIFKNVKSYSVSTGLDYRKNFNLLVQKIRLL